TRNGRSVEGPLQRTKARSRLRPLTTSSAQPSGSRRDVLDSRRNEIYSFHPGGANVVLADGSTHFLRDGIDVRVLGQLVTRAAGQPDRKGVGVVVAAVVTAALDHRRAAELAAPDHQRVVQQAALLQVLDQGGAGPVGVLAVLGQVLLEVAVLVPGLVEQFHEAD